MIVYEYFTTSAYDANDRITGWQQWNTNTYPEKSVFAKNQQPTAEMNEVGALFDSDWLPKFILFDDGHIELTEVIESIKITMYDVMKRRFDNDYGIDAKLELTEILADESGSVHPKIKEFKRRKKEVDDLKP